MSPVSSYCLINYVFLQNVKIITCKNNNGNIDDDYYYYMKGNRTALFAFCCSCLNLICNFNIDKGGCEKWWCDAIHEWEWDYSLLERLSRSIYISKWLGIKQLTSQNNNRIKGQTSSEIIINILCIYVHHLQLEKGDKARWPLVEMRMRVILQWKWLFLRNEKWIWMGSASTFYMSSK